MSNNIKYHNYKYIIPKLDSTLFTWSRWRNGSIHDLDIQACRYALITSIDGKQKLQKYAVGYCFGEELMCRPKQNQIAIMFEKNNLKFWFHLRIEEFVNVFKI